MVCKTPRGKERFSANKKKKKKERKSGNVLSKVNANNLSFAIQRKKERERENYNNNLIAI